MAESLSSTVALFRAFSMPGRKPRGEWFVPAIEVGTRSTCALNLNDPVVAEHHCTFRAVGGGFVVEDRGSVTGTWHNGVAVSAPVELKSGDQVVIGVTRLTIDIKVEAERAIFEVVVEEASFHYKKPKPGEFHTDADEWVRSEVRFGRIAAVRGMAWLAGLVAVAGMVWVFSTKSGEKLLQPGTLDGTHAALFATHPEQSVSSEVFGKVAFQGALSKVAHESCRVCHASSQPGDVASCVACHAEMSTRHPFITGVSTTDARLAPGVEQPSNSCRMCHDVQHAGLGAAASLDQARAKISEGTPDPKPGWGVCKNCHTSGLEADAMKRVGQLAAMLADANAKTSTDRHEYAFDEFSHEAHCGKSTAIDCAVCHVEAASVAGSERAADFRNVAFATCAACHVQGMTAATELPGITADALSAMRKQLASKKQLVSMQWHGRGDQCLACHAEVGKPLLKTVERELATKTYMIERMGHEQHAQASAGSKADCSKCHGDLKTLAGGAKSSGDFLHGSHVETLWPATLAEETRLSAESCSTCHAAQSERISLAGASTLDLGQACKTCHADKARPETEKLVTENVKDRKNARAVEFSHKRHTQVEGACFACHSFKGADDSDPRSRPVVADEVQNCTKCHNDHQNIEQGACTFCHPAGAGAGSGSAVLFKGEKPFRNDWPAGFQFKHFAGNAERGHRSYMSKAGATAAEGCAKCHKLDELRQAKAVSSVPIPGAQGTLCLDCHATNRGWFHWTLPDLSAR